MINNFNQIAKHLECSLNYNNFYFIQIIQRKKENPGLKSSNRLIKSYYVNSDKNLWEYKQEIIELCKAFNARAYIHLSPRNYEQMFIDMFTQMGEVLRNKQFNSLPKTFNTVCGKSKGRGARWIVDIDTKDSEFIAKVKDTVNSISSNENIIVDTIETKNGYHIITEAFNLQKFKEVFPDIEVHKNNPTILYCL